MNKILVVGATGNIGFEVIKQLCLLNTKHHIIAAIRDIPKGKKMFKTYPNVDFVHFDFEDPNTFDCALIGIDQIFLLRPPHISNLKRYFKPLIAAINKNKIKQVLFLSVQGAEKSTIIPHNKIEKLLLQNNLDYIFLRPSYFMQNLTTTLLKDIQKKRAIILPAGDAQFNWIDAENIGEAAAILLCEFEAYKNKAYEITGLENKNFYEVSALIQAITGEKMCYKSVNPLYFFYLKKQSGMKTGMIIVMLLLHFLPRFQKAPKISNFYEQLSQKKPRDLKTFITKHKTFFKP